MSHGTRSKVASAAKSTDDNITEDDYDNVEDFLLLHTQGRWRFKTYRFSRCLPWVHQLININRINTQPLLQGHWHRKTQPLNPGLTVKCFCLRFGVTDIMSNK